MKYIRTKNGKIYDMDSLAKSTINQEAYLTADNWLIYKNQIINQADTIEELCDEFVTKVIHPNPHGTKPHGYYMDGSSLFKDTAKYFLESIKEKGKTYDVYGGIWTEHGLQFVAKLNDKGELELL